MKQTIIGIVGPIASGKGFLADFLVRHGFAYWSLSDRVREEADRRGLTRDRSVLQDIGNELRSTQGPVVLVKQTLALIPESTELVVVDSIRNPMELDYLKAMGATIVGVNAAVENRLRWYLERAKMRGEDAATEADFRRANARDLGEGEDAFGQQGGECLRLADVKIFNDGTDRFLREGREALERYLGIDFDAGPEGPASIKESERLSPGRLRWRR